jgi:hypothetical protein
MKKTRLVLISAILALVGLAGCEEKTVDELMGDFAVTSVTLDQTYAKVEAGETLQLTPTITYQDEKEYSCYQEWRTSNAKIATVSEAGLVKALKPGNVSITFIAGFKSAACSINVPDNAEPIPVTPTDPTNPDASGSSFSISLNSTSITLVLDADAGGAMDDDEIHSDTDVHDNYQLVATTSEQATINWTSSDETVATVDQNGLVLAVSEGEAVVTASANGESVTCSVSVLAEAEEDLPPDDKMTVHIYFFIDYNNVDEEDLTGKKLLAKFWWYEDRPIAESGKVPANPTNAPISAFPYFAGWSDHPIIDSKTDLIDLSTYSVSSRSFLYIYGIWTDVQGGM